MAVGVMAGSAAAEPQWRHALSLIGEPAYPADFTHFKWVNPDAPKGGSATLAALGTYDTFNPFPPGANVGRRTSA